MTNFLKIENEKGLLLKRWPFYNRCCFDLEETSYFGAPPQRENEHRHVERRTCHGLNPVCNTGPVANRHDSQREPERECSPGKLAFVAGIIPGVLDRWNSRDHKRHQRSNLRGSRSRNFPNQHTGSSQEETPRIELCPLLLSVDEKQNSRHDSSTSCREHSPWVGLSRRDLTCEGDDEHHRPHAPGGQVRLGRFPENRDIQRDVSGENDVSPDDTKMLLHSAPPFFSMYTLRLPRSRLSA